MSIVFRDETVTRRWQFLATIYTKKIIHTCGVLQHEWYEGPQLCLSHLFHRGGDAFDDQGWKLVACRVTGRDWGRLLGQGRLKLRHDHRPQVLQNIFQGLGPKRPEIHLAGLAS